MIEVFTGKLGGGKSYHAVSRMSRQLALGGLVVTNIDLDWPEMVRYCDEKYGVRIEERQYRRLVDEMETVTVVNQLGKSVSLEVSKIYNFHSMVPKGTLEFPVLAVIDEAHLYFNSRDYAITDKLGRAMLAYLSQSRKVGNDLILIVQDWRNLDAQFIRQLQYLWKFRDMSKFFIPGFGCAWPCNVPIIGRAFPEMLSVQLDTDGATILTKLWERKNKRIFKLYRTDDLLRPIAGQCEEEFQRLALQKTRKEKPKMLKLLPIFFIVCIFLGIRGVLKVVEKGKEAEASATVVKSSAPASPGNTIPGTIQPFDADPLGAQWVQRPGGWQEATTGFFAVSSRFASTEIGTFRVGEQCEFGTVRSIGGGSIVLEGYGGEKLRIRLYRTRIRSDTPVVGPSSPSSPSRPYVPSPERHDLGIGG